MRALVAVLVLAGCGSNDERAGPTEAPCRAPYVMRGDGCAPRFDACSITQVPILGGGCADVGVAPALCPDGTTSDGSGGCTVTLPSEPCAAGTMALAGESACRPVAECGSERFPTVTGDVAYVDAAYRGGASDGSALRPHTSIGAAVAAAKVDATIAIAAGTYSEALTLSRAVKLVGVCPSKTEIAGGTATEVVSVRAAATLSRLAVSGGTNGIVVRGGPGASLDHVWIHDVGNAGLDARAQSATTTIRDARVEANSRSGALGVFGGKLVIERVSVRMYPPVGTGTRYGIIASPPASPTKPTELVASQVVIDQVAASGPFLFSQSLVKLDSVIVRGIGPLAPTTRESAIHAKGGGDFANSLTVRRTILDRPFGTPLSLYSGAKADIEGLVVRARDSYTATVVGGEGSIRSALFEGGTGIIASTGTTEPVRLSFERVIVRNGVDGNVSAGIRCSRPREVPAVVRVDSSRIEAMFTAGIAAYGCDVSVSGSLVRAMRATSGKFGDGVAAFADGDWGPATLSVVGSSIEGNARAGILLAASLGTIRDSQFSCNAFDLDVERVYVRTSAGTREGDYKLEDQGGSACGCDGSSHACKALSASLEPIPMSPAP